MAPALRVLGLRCAQPFVVVSNSLQPSYSAVHLTALGWPLRRMRLPAHSSNPNAKAPRFERLELQLFIAHVDRCVQTADYL